jgi:uncharacterized membrane protein YdjX (TVP38/TMEM64 family)
MSFPVKLTILIALMAGLLLAPYAIWHEPLDAYFASDAYQEALTSAKPYAWLIGLALLAGDAFLPVPAMPVMAAMGTLYGTVLGSVLSVAGSILAGLVGWGIGRVVGRRALRGLANEAEIERLQQFFDSWGAAGIVLSRALPVVPEVMTVLAGSARMHLGRLVTALVLGAVPLGISMAWAGDWTRQSTALLLVLTLVPAGLWCVYLVLVSRGRARPAKDSPQV